MTDKIKITNASEVYRLDEKRVVMRGDFQRPGMQFMTDLAFTLTDGKYLIMHDRFNEESIYEVEFI